MKTQMQIRSLGKSIRYPGTISIRCPGMNEKLAEKGQDNESVDDWFEMLSEIL